MTEKRRLTIAQRNSDESNAIDMMSPVFISKMAIGTMYDEATKFIKIQGTQISPVKKETAAFRLTNHLFNTTLKGPATNNK